MSARERISSTVRSIRCLEMCAISALSAFLIFGCSSARFNTYYNANKNFQEAVQLSKNRAPTSSPTGPEVAKLDKCLEKCGVIIARHSTSSLVDDALFLMGKALALKQEHGSAAEKFSELRTYFPNSEHVTASYYLEARERVELEQWTIAENLLRIDTSSDDSWSIWQERSALLLAQIAEWNDDCDIALSRLEAVFQNSGRKEVLGTAYLTKGRCLRLMDRHEEAINAFEKAYQTAENREEKFESRVEKGETLALVDRGDEALETFQDLESIARADSELAQVGLSVGRSLRSLDRIDEAEDAWRNVILAYPRTNASKWARMELASMLELYSQDFSAALQEYEELSKQGRPRLLVERASRRAKALREVKQMTEALQDSAANRGSTMMKLADTYLFKLQLADSALGYYRQAHSDYPESSWAPRALFVEAWIIEDRGDSSSDGSALLYDRLTESYPNSPQARSVLAGRGAVSPEAGGLSFAAWLYAAGETFWLEERAFDKAKDVFETLIDSFPKAPETPKALLACAWIASESRDDTVEVKGYLERLLNDYPASEPARLASTILGKSAGATKLPYDIPPTIVGIDTVKCTEIAPVDSTLRLGIIRVRVLVDASGDAQTVEMIRGSKSLLCDDAVMQAARAAEYEPARKDTVMVEAWLDVDVPFIPAKETQPDSTQG